MSAQNEAIQAVIEKRRAAIRGEEVLDEEQVEADEAEAEDESPAEVEEGEEAGEAAEPELPAEVEEEPEVEPEAQEEEGDFFVLRYKNREEAERGYAEKEATTQRANQRAAAAEQRQAELEEQLAAFQQYQQQSVQIDPNEWMEWAQESLQYVTPDQVWQRAWDEGGPTAADVVIQAMYISDNPAVRRYATQYDNALGRAFEQQEQAPELERQRQERAAQGYAQEAVSARAEMIRRHPDYEQAEDEMISFLTSLDDNDRVILEQVAQAGGTVGKIHALSYLYNAVRSETPERLVEARVAERKKAEERSRAKKINATVALATASPERTPLTEAEREDIVIRNRIRGSDTGKASGMALLDEFGEEIG